MPLVIPPNFALVRYFLANTRGDHTAVVEHGVQVADPPQTATTVALRALTAYNTTNGVRSVLATSTTLQKITVLLGADGPPTRAEVSGAGSPGALTGSLLTPGISLLVRKNTEFSGRKYRGRFFLPDVLEGAADDAGLINSTDLGNYNTRVGVWFTALGAGNIPAYLLHTDATAPTILISFTVGSFVSSQRKRQRRS